MLNPLGSLLGHLKEFYRIVNRNKNLLSSANGFQIGEVIDNNDPLKLGRLRIYVPGKDESVVLSNGNTIPENTDKHWIPYVSPFGGMHDAGMFFVPDVGAKVVVGFFNNDYRDRFWIGAIYNPNSNNPPIESIGSKLTNYPQNRIIKTPAGHTIELDDSAGYERIEITSKTGHCVALEDYRETLKIVSKGDLYLKAEGNIFLDAEAGIFMKSNLGTVVNSGGNIDLVTPKDVNVEHNMNVHNDFTVHTGAVTVVDGSINVNGNVLATGNMLCEGFSSNHHRHIVIAEAIDRDVDGSEIVDKRIIRASHVHTYQDKHIVKNHTHDVDSKDGLEGSTRVSNLHSHVIPGATCNKNIVMANNELHENEFVTTKRITERDCHEHLGEDILFAETLGDDRTRETDMSISRSENPEAGRGKTGAVKLDVSGEQQNTKTASPPSMIDSSNRKIDVILEQVDRDYYKTHDLHDTPFAVMQHKHSVRGIAI